MTNLEAKKEAIKNAYGEYWEKLEYFINKNGWAYNFFEEIGIEIFGSEADFKNSIFWRPKSLQGIENNNGWIRIENESDLPKKAIQCFYVDKYENKVCLGVVDKNDFDNVSHYQPIEKPKPPIF